MSVTQYIGARYVPLFADPIAWDITKQYEPLTIVYYQGNSYTSKQSVPANIDISNTDYWALTGNYNAQIEQYRAEVQTYDNRITANTTSNTAQDAQLAGTSSSGLKTLIDANASDIDSLENADDVFTAQLAGTSNSGLKTLIDANTDSNTAQDAQLAGTTNSGLKSLIENLSTKISILEQLSNAPIYMTPTYIGDYMINQQFGSVAHVGSNFYCFNTGNYDNTGTLKIFSELTNTLISNKTIQVGHANSCAYDSVRNAFWIAPHITYSAGQGSYTTDLYKYDTSFNTLNVVNTGAPNTVFAVSFDATTDTLYCYDRMGSALTCFAMESDESTFTQKWSVNLTDYAPSTWQDVFCYDGFSYLLQPEGTVHIINPNGELVGSGEVDNLDDNRYWHFGECEGWECDASGCLYMARNGATGITMENDNYNINDAFVTAVSFGKNTKTGINSRNAPYPTATLKSENISKFTLPNAQLRSLNQINFIEHNFSSITIPSGDTFVEEYGKIRLPSLQNITLEIVGSYECHSFAVSGGDYTIIVTTNGSLKINASDYFIALVESRSPIIRFRSKGTLTFNGTQLVHPTTSNIICWINTTTQVVYHSTTVPANNWALFIGTVAVAKSWT